MKRSELEALRVAAHKKLEEAPRKEWLWWLDAVTCIEAELMEVNTHHPDSYFTEGRIRAYHVYSDSKMEARDRPVTINSLKHPWQILALVRIMREWEEWLRNERDGLSAPIECPDYVLSKDENEWVSKWPGGNPWPEAER